MAVTHKLEISFDPLSDLTPTWTDVSSRLLEVPAAKLGVDDDLSDMQAGSATFRLDNRDRALEPGYAAGAYYPNVRPLRRIRYLINDGSTDWPMFYGYITSWGPEWPGGMNQEAIITAVDGSMILEMDNLPLLDPPAASSYEEVVQFDDPWGYYRLGEDGGTRAVAVFRKVGRGKKRRRVRAGSRQVTAAEVGGVAGAAGRYEGLPTLGRPGLILGDPDTCVRFTGDSTASQLAVVVTDANSFSSRQAFTVEAWIKPVATDAVEVQQYVTGPSSASAVMFNLYAEAGASGNFILDVENSAATLHTVDSGMDATVGVTRHVVGMLDDKILRVFIDGVQVATLGFTGLLPVASTTQALTVGGTFGTSAFEIDEVAVYEHALTPERVLAHYLAGAQRGFAQETTGFRIVGLADNPLWSTAFIQTAGHDVEPQMKYGQSRLEEIKEAVRADLPSGLLYFLGTGNPQYLAWGYGDTAPYNAVQTTFGNAGGAEVPFLDCQTTDDDELYNIVTTSREGGLAQTATDEDSRAEFYDRGYELSGLTHADDMSCLTVAHAILADHSQPEPPVRVKSLTLTGDTTSALAEILERMPGDLIRVKHRPKGGTAIDIITRIRGRTLTVSPLDGGNRVISCTWTLARGFNAAVAEWRLGVTGYSELQTTTVLG